LSYLITAVVSLIVPIAIGIDVYGGELIARWQDWRWWRAYKRETEGTVWLEHEGTTYITESPGNFGFLIVARDGQGNDVWRMTDRPLAGFPIVDGLDELVGAGRAWFIASNSGYPLVYACRAKDLPSAGLDGDAWLRVEAWDAS